MTDQPERTDGIEHPLDEGLADARTDDRDPDAASATRRTDPDDPVAGMQEAARRSDEPD